jgi:hypothetical protein
MSDTRLSEALERVAAENSDVDLARFQDNVWQGLEATARPGLDLSGLPGALAIRAAPALLALLVGSMVGVGLASPSQTDLLSVFDSRAEWPLASVSHGEVGL